MEIGPGDVFYHVNTTSLIPWSQKRPMQVGDEIMAGDGYNPFFSYYLTHHTVPYRLKDGSVRQANPINFLRCIHAGALFDNVVQPTYQELSRYAVEINNEYMNLSKEVIYELVRVREFGNRPSRWTCIWLIENEANIGNWNANYLGRSDHQIVRLEVLECIKAHRADVRLFRMENEGYGILEEQARKYWAGLDQDHEKAEILFEGKLRVAEIQRT